MYGKLSQPVSSTGSQVNATLVLSAKTLIKALFMDACYGGIVYCCSRGIANAIPSCSPVLDATRSAEITNWRNLGTHCIFRKKLMQEEQKYSILDRELLALPLEIRHFRFYIEGSKNNSFVESLSQISINIQYQQYREVDYLTFADVLEKEESTMTQNAGYQFEVALWCDVSNGWARPIDPLAWMLQIFDSFHRLSDPGMWDTKRWIASKFSSPRFKKELSEWAHSC
ncbi:hypothetical protein RF11_14750 [Thelohanellus kitauei]|uniref:Reverse transcriptase RNase H-like domain-containing protein n=1 Tax=Thelohanellus kitauei TaxID=669202 RepID=A0A0C2JAR9_THEKT|nr:hypothetical protein RF11_14750 [Thelohanellus kitauei]